MRGRSDLIRRLAAASILGQLTWLVLVSVAGLIEPGYSEVDNAVSELGARGASHPWLFEVAVTIWGASFVAAAGALVLDGPRGFRGLLGPGLVAFTGLTEILAGFPFPAACRPTIDPGCHARELSGDLPWQHFAHGWAFFLGSIAIELSVFAMAWRFRGDGRWGRADLLAVASGLLGLPMLAGLFFAAGGDTSDNWGLVQRIGLTAGGLWVGSLTVGLLAVHGRPRDPASRLVGWIRRLPGGRVVPLPGSGLRP